MILTPTKVSGLSDTILDEPRVSPWRETSYLTLEVALPVANQLLIDRVFSTF